MEPILACMPPPVCNQKNTINNFKTFETIKKVASKEECNDICQDFEDDCDFWNFKVMHKNKKTKHNLKATICILGQQETEQKSLLLDSK